MISRRDFGLSALALALVQGFPAANAGNGPVLQIIMRCAGQTTVCNVSADGKPDLPDGFVVPNGEEFTVHYRWAHEDAETLVTSGMFPASGVHPEAVI